jgi:hypothetical protein
MRIEPGMIFKEKQPWTKSYKQAFYEIKSVEEKRICYDAFYEAVIDDEGKKTMIFTAKNKLLPLSSFEKTLSSKKCKRVSENELSAFIAKAALLK